MYLLPIAPFLFLFIDAIFFQNYYHFKYSFDSFFIMSLHISFHNFKLGTDDYFAAAAAKSLQSCPTLCNPIPGILQARTLEWVGISSSNAWKWKWKWSHSVISDSLWPQGLQPTRLLRPWDFPGKSTGVGCHCLLQMTILEKDKLKKKKKKRINYEKIMKFDYTLTKFSLVKMSTS